MVVVPKIPPGPRRDPLPAPPAQDLTGRYDRRPLGANTLMLSAVAAAGR